MASRCERDDRGRLWCTHRTAKLVYSTLDDAWSDATRIFVESGFILTPYKCGRSKTYTGVVRVRITRKPYAFNPYRQFIGTTKRTIKGCGQWHLTSHPTYVLPP